MVGVPCFLLCQVGPDSRMVWPKCSRRSAGITKQPDSAVMVKAPIAAAASIQDTIVPMWYSPKKSGIRQFRVQCGEHILQFHGVARLGQHHITGVQRMP